MWPFRKPAVTTKSLADPSADLFALFGSLPTSAGVPVTALTAMRVPAVRAAVQTIAETVGQLPVEITDRTSKKPIDSPLNDLLNGAANAWTSAYDFQEQLVRDSLLHGDGLASIVRVNGEPRELIRVRPGMMTIAEGAYGQPVYSSGAGEIDPLNVFHLKSPSLVGYRGESPVTLAREAIGLAALLEEFTSKLYANGAALGGVIQHPGALGDEALKKMRAAWRAAHEGAGNAGKTAVLWDGATFNPTAFSPVDGQLLELRRFCIAEIGRAFGVPAQFLGDLDRMTWSNIEALNRQFLQMTLLPWLERLQGEISLKLLTAEQRATTSVKYNVDALLKADFAARYAGYSQAITARILNPNEIREMEDLPPYEGGEVYANPAVTPGAPANDNLPKPKEAVA